MKNRGIVPPSVRLFVEISNTALVSGLKNRMEVIPTLFKCSVCMENTNMYRLQYVFCEHYKYCTVIWSLNSEESDPHPI